MARCSPGVGTNLHLLGEPIKSEEKLNLTHVPYRNFGTAFQDAMAGRVDLVVAACRRSPSGWRRRSSRCWSPPRPRA
jgi:tripartite-type tricarboxylate transporter receptor subunit TctC